MSQTISTDNRTKRVYQKLSESAGLTPLVKLNRITRAYPQADVFAKIEFTNPMGSIKDRIARHLINKALTHGVIKQGDTIIENSSGNTAMGLAMMAIENNLNCKIVVRDTTAKEKLDALRAVGADLVIVDAKLPPEHPDSYNKKVFSILKEHPEYFFPDQHNNHDNNVYSFCIPTINDKLDAICIEFYYKIDELKTKDKFGRRIFIGEEFKGKGDGNSKCGKYITQKRNTIALDIIDRDKKVFLIDDIEKKNNIALSKNDFTNNIINDVEGFDNFDIENFKLIFDVIEKIVND